MQIPLIIVCFEKFQVPFLLIASVKLLKISIVYSFHVLKTLFSNFVDCKTGLYIFDEVVNICFVQRLNILLNLGIILLLCDPSTRDWSSYSICCCLMEVNIVLIINWMRHNMFRWFDLLLFLGKLFKWTNHLTPLKYWLDSGLRPDHIFMLDQETRKHLMLFPILLPKLSMLALI